MSWIQKPAYDKPINSRKTTHCHSWSSAVKLPALSHCTGAQLSFMGLHSRTVAPAFAVYLTMKIQGLLYHLVSTIFSKPFKVPNHTLHYQGPPLIILLAASHTSRARSFLFPPNRLESIWTLLTSFYLFISIFTYCQCSPYPKELTL